jgi:hypothetical protein
MKRREFLVQHASVPTLLVLAACGNNNSSYVPRTSVSTAGLMACSLMRSNSCGGPLDVWRGGVVR